MLNVIQCDSKSEFKMVGNIWYGWTVALSAVTFNRSELHLAWLVKEP